jgi:hypothetical protein
MKLVTTPPFIPTISPRCRRALAAERVARQQAEARASSAGARVAHLKLLISEMKPERFGQSSERGRQLLGNYSPPGAGLRDGGADARSTYCGSGMDEHVDFG